MKKTPSRWLIIPLLLTTIACGTPSPQITATQTTIAEATVIVEQTIVATVIVEQTIVATVIVEQTIPATVIVEQTIPVTVIVEQTVQVTQQVIATPPPTQAPTQAPTNAPLPTSNPSPNFVSLQFDNSPFIPQSILFDGAYLWVGGQHRDLILKIDPATGDIIQVVGVAKFGVGIPDLAFDGVHIWALVNQSVVKVRASDGAIIGTYYFDFDNAGFTPQSILYANQNIWVGGKYRDLLIKLNPTSGDIIQVIGLAKLGVGVPDLVSDRTYIYAAVNEALIQVRASSGVIEDTFYYNFDSSPFYAQNLVYDGQRVWAGGRNRDLAVGINPSTGTTQIVPLGKTGTGVPALLYHQNDLWAIVLDQLIRIDLTNAAVIGQVPLIPSPIALASDGASIWIAIAPQGILINP